MPNRIELVQILGTLGLPKSTTGIAVVKDSAGWLVKARYVTPNGNEAYSPITRFSSKYRAQGARDMLWRIDAVERAIRANQAHWNI